MTQLTPRRTFLRGAAAALTTPFFVPASALGRQDRPAASERITMALIGCGGMGGANLNAFPVSYTHLTLPTSFLV